jgi:hypothetical protein
MRDLTGPSQGRAIRELLQGLLVAETLHPSDPLWVLSGWITDIAVVDNRAGRFSHVDSEWPLGPVSISAILGTIVRRGGSVALVLREVDHNRAFLNRLRMVGRSCAGRLRAALTSDFHEKGLVGADYDLSGSMNFTHRGIEVNDEHLILRTDPQAVAARRLTLDAHWRTRLDACA